MAKNKTDSARVEVLVRSRDAHFYDHPGHQACDAGLVWERNYLVMLLRRYDAEIERRAVLADMPLYKFMYEANHCGPL